MRAQLVEAERLLSGDPAVSAEGSDLLTLLLDADDAELVQRHTRVAEALAGFDAATIATTHQFCSMVLGSLGVAGDTDARARLVENLDDLVGEVVDDLYLRAFAFADAPPVFSHTEARAIARSVVNDPQAHLEPADDDRSTPPGRRVAFAHAVRDELETRKRRLGILSYDDLLQQLADALEPDRLTRTHPHARALEHRAGRRVPGHRPGAVAGPRPGVQRRRDDGPDRRPQAGDLRLPRRRRHDLPRRRPPPPGPSRPSPSTGAATPACSTPSRSCSSAPSSATIGSSSTTSRPTTSESRLRRRAARRAAAAAGRAPRHLRQAAHRLADGRVRCVPHIARDLAIDVRRLLASGATFDGRAARAARRRGHLLPPRRPRRPRSRRCSRSGCRR